MMTVDTFTAQVYCGMKHGYVGPQIDPDSCKKLLRKYVDQVGLCVSVDEVDYIYTGGSEKGVRITLINYPRFPSTIDTIRERALVIARLMMEEFEQQRVTIVMPDKTFTLEMEDLDASETSD